MHHTCFLGGMIMSIIFVYFCVWQGVDWRCWKDTNLVLNGGTRFELQYLEEEQMVYRWFQQFFILTRFGGQFQFCELTNICQMGWNHHWGLFSLHCHIVIDHPDFLSCEGRTIPSMLRPGAAFLWKTEAMQFCFNMLMGELYWYLKSLEHSHNLLNCMAILGHQMFKKHIQMGQVFWT